MSAYQIQICPILDPPQSLIQPYNQTPEPSFDHRLSILNIQAVPSIAFAENQKPPRYSLA